MIRGGVLALLALSILAALSACQAPPEPPARTIAAPVKEQAHRGDSQTGTASAARSFPPQSPSPAPEPAYPDIDTLKGEISARITALLGEPDFRRTDKPAQLWQYRHPACSLDLFLYPMNRAGSGPTDGADSSALSVDHLDVRSFGEASLSRQACFVAILKSRSAKGQGSGQGQEQG